MAKYSWDTPRGVACPMNLIKKFKGTQNRNVWGQGSNIQFFNFWGVNVCQVFWVISVI